MNAAYKIAPKEIAKPKDLREILYTEYLEGKGGDFQLISEEDTIIKIHSLILRVSSEFVFEKLLSSGMKESSEKIIVLKDYKENTIRAFIDYIYLGAPVFQEKAMLANDPNLDILELLSFAHCYQVLALIDCCTNLFCRIATKQDADNILKAAEFYGNTHLKALYNNLIEL